MSNFSVTDTRIPDVKLIVPRRFADERGFLCEVFNRPKLLELGVDIEAVQENYSHSIAAGTIRGLHFQVAPMAQAKFVRVTRGAIFDVAVDLRRGSPTFGRHASATLTAAGGEILSVPVGFAHGFCTLESATEVSYLLGAPHDPPTERGVLWNDPELDIDWPVHADAAVVSARDRQLPPFAELPDYFA